MCYNIAYLTKKKLQYARMHGASDEEISDLETDLKLFDEKYASYNTSGFAYPKIPVITNEQPKRFQLLTWGLIPSFMKDISHPSELQWNTLNCVGEKIFETKSFKNAALSKRCLIYVDGFFEPHHYKGRSYPFYVCHKNNEPMILGGLWEDNQHIQTVSIVTVEASLLLRKIHNDKKRMPLIIPKELRFEWLKHIDSSSEKESIREMICPYDDELLTTYSVPPIRNNKKAGWVSPGNHPDSIQKYVYPELSETYYSELIQNKY